MSCLIQQRTENLRFMPQTDQITMAGRLSTLPPRVPGITVSQTTLQWMNLSSKTVVGTVLKEGRRREGEKGGECRTRECN